MRSFEQSRFLSRKGRKVRKSYWGAVSKCFRIWKSRNHLDLKWRSSSLSELTPITFNTNNIYSVWDEFLWSWWIIGHLLKSNCYYISRSTLRMGVLFLIQSVSCWSYSSVIFGHTKCFTQRQHKVYLFWHTKFIIQ